MIQKSELQIVPVEQRVPGQWYGVDDDLDGELQTIVCYENGNISTLGCPWEYWFALPESMLLVREVMPDEFELKHGEWDVILKEDRTVITRIKNPTLNPFCIHAGTKSEQIAELEKILAELKQS